MTSPIARRYCTILCQKISTGNRPSDSAVTTKMETYWSSMKKSERLNWKTKIQRMLDRHSEQLQQNQPELQQHQQHQEPKQQQQHQQQQRQEQQKVRPHTSRRATRSRDGEEDGGDENGDVSSADAKFGASDPINTAPAIIPASKKNPHQGVSTDYKCIDCGELATCFCFQCRALYCQGCLSHHKNLKSNRENATQHTPMEVQFYAAVIANDGKPTKSTEKIADTNVSNHEATPIAASSSSSQPAQVTASKANPSYPCGMTTCSVYSTEACVECAVVVCSQCRNQHDITHSSSPHTFIQAHALKLIQEKQTNKRSQLVSSRQQLETSAAAAATTAFSSGVPAHSFARFSNMASSYSSSVPASCSSPPHSFFRNMPTVISPPQNITEQMGGTDMIRRQQHQQNMPITSCDTCEMVAPQRGCGHCGRAFCLECARAHAQTTAHALCELNVLTVLRTKFGIRPYLLRHFDQVQSIPCRGQFCHHRIAAFICVRCFNLYCFECGDRHVHDKWRASYSRHDIWPLDSIDSELAKTLMLMAQNNATTSAHQTGHQVSQLRVYEGANTNPGFRRTYF